MTLPDPTKHYYQFHCFRCGKTYREEAETTTYADGICGDCAEAHKAERLLDAAERAPQELKERMKQALEELGKGLPPAGEEVRNARCTW